MERCASRSLARFRASCSGVNEATLRVPAREDLGYHTVLIPLRLAPCLLLEGGSGISGDSSES